MLSHMYSYISVSHFNFMFAFRFFITLSLFISLVNFVNYKMEFTEEEKTQLLQRISEFGVKPKTDSKEDFGSWMSSMVGQNAGQAGDVNKSVVTKEHIPRIPTFTGATPSKADHVVFDVWQYEIKCLINGKRYSEESILQAIRNSLRGDASKVVVRLGDKVTVEQVLQRMNNLYGSVFIGQDILAEFYSAHQLKDESVVAWSCRLEDLMQQAIVSGKMNVTDKEEALRAKMWSGLRKELREISGHKYDNIKDYDELLVELRKIEKDSSSSGSVGLENAKKAKVNSVQVLQTQTQDCELKAMIEQLQSKVNDLEKKQFSGFSQSKEVICWNCGQAGHVKSGCRNKPKGHLNKSRSLERGSQQTVGSKPQK